MIEFLILAFLALNGFLCTGLLVAMLLRSARDRESRLREHPLSGRLQGPQPLSPPNLPYLLLERYPPSKIVPVMAEFFPAAYERYRRGVSNDDEREWVWEACGAIHDAREEIEELCS